MTDFGDRLRDSLSIDDEEFLKSLENERGIFTQMFVSFQGPMRFWTGFVIFFSIVFFILAIWSFFRIMDAKSATDIALWLAAFFCCVLTVALTKMWYWMRLNHLGVLRELKKIELRIARISDAN